jgi:integrase
LSWRYRYRLNGKPEKATIGRYPDISLKKARDERDRMARLVVNGRSPAREKQLAKKALASDSKVRDFAERYYNEIVTKRLKDPRNIRRYLDKEVIPAFGNKSLRDVTAADIQAVVFRKRDNGREAAAAAIRNLIKRLFDYAIVCGAAQHNPALALPMRFITQARPRTRALSPNEIREYLQTIYRCNIRRQFKLALHLVLLTLTRKSELMLAKWEHLNFEAGEWEIPAENSKTRKPHVVYLSRQAGDLFHELKVLAGGSEWVLPGRSSLEKPFAHTALNQALAGINFNIEPFTIHDLRRTASTLLHEMGFPSDVIEKALNHTIGGVRGVYNRAEYGRQRKQMLQNWADFVEALATEQKVMLADFAHGVA